MYCRSTYAGWYVGINLIPRHDCHCPRSRPIVKFDCSMYFADGRRPIRVLYIWEGGLGIWGAIALGAPAAADPNLAGLVPRQAAIEAGRYLESAKSIGSPAFTRAELREQEQHLRGSVASLEEQAVRAEFDALTSVLTRAASEAVRRGLR